MPRVCNTRLRRLEGETDAHYDTRLASLRAYERARKKKLTVEQLEELIAKHAGRCALCGVEPPHQRDGRTGLYIDHRHDNGAIRGMLCNRCNLMVGFADQSASLLVKVLEYAKIGAGAS